MQTLLNQGGDFENNYLVIITLKNVIQRDRDRCISNELHSLEESASVPLCTPNQLDAASYSSSAPTRSALTELNTDDNVTYKAFTSQTTISQNEIIPA